MRGNARIEEQVPCQEPDELWPVSSPELNRTKRNYVGAGGSRGGGQDPARSSILQRDLQRGGMFQRGRAGSSPMLHFTTGITKERVGPGGGSEIQQ